MSTAAAVLQATDLRVTLPTPLGSIQPVRGVQIALRPGQRLGVVGESGCGKSMLALAIMGLLPEQAHTSGDLQLNGENLLQAEEHRWNRIRGNQVAMVFQEPMTALNPLHTVGDQIAEPLRIHKGLDREQARAKALELLERVAMPQAAQRLDSYPHQLSGGQRQRVGIAIALACEPKLLIADEPTTALDVTVQAQILTLIQKLVSESNMALVLISHDLRLVQRHVDSVAVMYAGQIVEHGPVAQVFSNPLHPYTQGLMAARPSLHGPRGQPLPTIAGRVVSLHQVGAGCAFAPRCHKAIDACGAAAVDLTTTGQTQVRCIRAAEDAA
jgi:peptide/nickel transport system ATP-binding protein